MEGYTLYISASLILKERKNYVFLMKINSLASF